MPGQIESYVKHFTQRAENLAVRAALLCSLALVLTASSFAQLTSGTGWVPLRTDYNVLSSELSRHLPANGIRRQTRYVGGLRWETTHTLSVMAETRLGLSTKTWRSDTRIWTEWTHHGNPLGAPIQRIPGSGDSPGIDTGLTMMVGYGAATNDWIAYQGVGLPTTRTDIEVDFKTGIHQVDPVGRTLVASQSVPTFATVGSAALPASFNHFNPQASVFSESPISTSRLIRHVFGTGVPRGHVQSSGRFATVDIPLIELRRDQSRRGWLRRGAERRPDCLSPRQQPGSELDRAGLARQLRLRRSARDSVLHEHPDRRRARSDRGFRGGEHGHQFVRVEVALP